MQVNASITRREKVDVSTHDLIEATIEVVRTKAKLERGIFLSKGNLAYWEEHYHGSDTLIITREATEAEAEALRVMAYLESIKWTK